jgi:DNA-binding SARP family transcriptional activator
MIDSDRLALDVDAFEAKAVAGLAAAEQSHPARAERKLAGALDLYRDDFLPNQPYAEWAFAEREYLRNLAGRAMRACGQLALRAGRPDDAAAHFQRLARLEPFDTDVQQQLIEVLLRRGRRSEAMRHYEALRLRMLRAFGDEPDFDLADIAARLAGEGTAVG